MINKKIAVWFAVLLMLSSSVFAGYTILEDNQDLRYEQLGVDLWNTKALKIPSIGGVADNGYIQGDMTQISFLGNNMTIDVDDGSSSVSCRFTDFSGDADWLDYLYVNGTHFGVVIPAFGEFFDDYEFPEPRSPITCTDIDGDGLDEAIIVNYQGGELVLQVLEYNPSSGEIEQKSVNVISDLYSVTHVEPIKCNVLSGDAESRCFFVAYDIAVQGTAKVISVAKNSGEDNFYFADDETIWSVTSFGTHTMKNNIVFPGDDYNRWYTWLGDRIYYLDYSFGTEKFTINTYANMSGEFIYDFQALNDLKRGSKTQPDTNRYDDKLMVLHFLPVTLDESAGGSIAITMNVSIFDKILFNSTSTSHSTANSCYYPFGLLGDVRGAAFQYDLDGNGYKDVMYFGYSHTGFAPNLINIRECLGVFYLNNETNIQSFDSAVTSIIYSTVPQAVLYARAAFRDEAVILDMGDDGTDDVAFIRYGAFTDSNSNRNSRNNTYRLSNTDMISGILNINELSIPGEYEAFTFGDYNMDEYIDLFVPEFGQIYWHQDGDAIDVSPIFTFNNTENECGDYAGNSDNYCEVLQNNTYLFSIIANDPEGSPMQYSYRCSNEDSASPLVDYSLDNNTFSCYYPTRKNATISVWVTDEGIYENIQQSNIAIISASGVCVANNYCEYYFGETTTNCPVDCVACNDGLDNDNDTFIDYPDDTGCFNATDGSETNVAECNDGYDNDGDGFIDYPSDVGCSGLSDSSERYDTQCDDGIDNDLDGLTDYPYDTSCESKLGTTESDAQCNDNIDNDGDGWTDFPDDLGCDNIFDNNEYNAEEVSFYDIESWWSQYQYDNKNFGYNDFDGQTTFDSGITNDRLITVNGDYHQPMIADVDGDDTPELVLIDNGDLYIFSWDDNNQEFTIEYSVSLDAFTPAIPTNTMDATPVLHKYGNKVYIVLLDDSKVFTLQYSSGGVLMQSYTNAITGDATKTGIKCQSNTPYCWLVTDDNKVVRVNILAGVTNVYETSASLQSINQELYREPALNDIDNKDAEEFVFTYYDKPNDDMGIVVFDTYNKVLDTGFSSDGILSEFCDSENWGSWVDIFGVMSNPMIADIYGDSRKEIVVSCGMYETNSGSYIARAFNHVITSTGVTAFEDTLLDDNNYVIFSSVDYMNYSSNASEKYLIIDQPVVSVFADGTAGFCTRAFQQIGTSSNNLITRGDVRCYEGLSTVTEKFGKVCGDTSDDSSINPCNYADNMTNACFYGGECGMLHTPVSAELYTVSGSEIVNYFGIWNVSSLYENAIFEFNDDIIPYDSEYAIGDINKDDSLDVIVTTQFGSITDIYHSSYTNEYPTLQGFTVSTRSPVCLGTEATFTISTNDYTDVENNPVQIQVALVGSEMSDQWSESSMTPSDTFVFNVAGYITVNMWIKDIYMSNTQFENGLTATFYVTSDTFNCFDFYSCHYPACDPSTIPSSGGTGNNQGNTPNNDTLPWTNAFLVNNSFWEYTEGSYQSQLSLSHYPGIVFDWNQCTNRGYRKTWACLPRIVFWDGLNYILNIMLNNVKIIVVFLFIIVFLVVIGYGTYQRVVKR